MTSPRAIEPCMYCGQPTALYCDECDRHACGHHGEYFRVPTSFGLIRRCYDCIDVSVEGFSAPQEVST